MADKPLKNVAQWRLEVCEPYLARRKKYEKKRSAELAAVHEQLQTYFTSLTLCGEPQQVVAGWIHSEPAGIKALTEKAKGRKGSLRATRLYVYPRKKNRTLYVLHLGSKDTQSADIQECRKVVQAIRASIPEDTNQGD